MNKIIKKLASLILISTILTMVFAGCSKRDDDTKSNSADVNTELSSESISSKPEESLEEPPSSEESQKAETLVYIGTVNTEFKEYAVDIGGEVTADKLIAAIADLTGWDLTLADTVSSGKGGMAVSFSPECALVTGPPLEQKDEFHVFDNYGLAQMILDSIQETLQKNFVMEPGEPSKLDIWYSMEDKPIEIEGVIISMEEPWSKQKVFG